VLRTYQHPGRWEILAIHTVVFQHRAVWYTVISVHKGIRSLPSRNHGGSRFLSNVGATYQTRRSSSHIPLPTDGWAVLFNHAFFFI